MDKELTLACWHADGTCDYGTLYAGLASAWVDWVWPIHEKMERTKHTIQNILIEIDGDKASAESYFIAYLRVQQEDGLEDIIFAGRYVDNFECRDGLWKIAHRRAIYDWDQVQNVTTHYNNTPGIAPRNPDGVTLRGLRSKQDYSYEAFDKLYR